MPRETFVLRNGRLVEKRRAAPLTLKTDIGIHVISDTMAPTKHMGTGRIHDSKSRFRADTRAMGCEEIGTEPVRARPRPEPSMHDIAMDVKKSIAQLRSR